MAEPVYPVDLIKYINPVLVCEKALKKTPKENAKRKNSLIAFIEVSFRLFINIKNKVLF
jgi:hypothetical protein